MNEVISGMICGISKNMIILINLFLNNTTIHATFYIVFRNFQPRQLRID